VDARGGWRRPGKGDGDARRRSGRKATRATRPATRTEHNGAADPFLSRSAAWLETTGDRVLRRQERGRGGAEAMDVRGLRGRWIVEDVMAGPGEVIRWLVGRETVMVYSCAPWPPSSGGGRAERCQPRRLCLPPPGQARSDRQEPSRRGEGKARAPA